MGDLGKEMERFLFSCKLSDRRLTSIRRNLPAAFADGCACAEIIHGRFPKLVDIHNYTEASSITARTSNWNLLNKKVLKKLNCELEVRNIDIFVNRKSMDQIVTFLKFLKAKMAAYEPVYATMEFPSDGKTKAAIYEKGTASIKPVTNRRISQKIDQDVVNARKDDLSKRLVSREAAESREMAEAVNEPTVSRRPSLAQTNKIMDKRRSREDVKRRASSMSEKDIEELYQRFSVELNQGINDEKNSIDEMQNKVDTITTKFNQLRNDNMEMLKKTEKRLSILISEPLNPLVEEDNLLDYSSSVTPKASESTEGGIDVVDDIIPKIGSAAGVFGAVESDEGETINLPPPPVDGSDDDMLPPGESSDDEAPPPPPSSYDESPITTMAKTNIPFSGQSKHPEHNKTDLGVTSQLYEELTGPNKRASQILKNGKALNAPSSTVTTSLGIKLRRGSLNLTKPIVRRADPSSTSSSSSNNSKRGSISRSADNISKNTDLKTSISSSGTQVVDTDEPIRSPGEVAMNSSTGSADDIPPPPPPVPPPVLLPSLLSEYPVYRRLYSEIHETYYFVDDKTQKSLWEVPEFGIVVSKDENSDKEYYTDCETGIVAWTVDSLVLKIEERMSD